MHMYTYINSLNKILPLEVIVFPQSVIDYLTDTLEALN